MQTVNRKENWKSWKFELKTLKKIVVLILGHGNCCKKFRRRRLPLRSGRPIWTSAARMAAWTTRLSQRNVTEAANWQSGTLRHECDMARRGFLWRHDRTRRRFRDGHKRRLCGCAGWVTWNSINLVHDIIHIHTHVEQIECQDESIWNFCVWKCW